MLTIHRLREHAYLLLFIFGEGETSRINNMSHILNLRKTESALSRINGHVKFSERLKDCTQSRNQFIDCLSVDYKIIDV